MVSARIRRYGTSIRNGLRVMSAFAARTRSARNSRNSFSKKGSGGNFKSGKKVPSKLGIDIKLPVSFTKSKNSRKRRKLDMSIEHRNGKVKLPTISIRGGLGKLKRLKNEFKYSVTKNYIFSAGTGLQSVGEGLVVANLTELTGSALSSSRSLKGTWDVSPYTLNPYVQSMGSSTLYTPSYPVHGDKLHYIGCNLHYTILNMESVACEVTVMWCVPKTNTAFSPYNVWNAVVSTEESNYQAGQTTSATLATGTAVSGWTGASDYGNHPRESPSFTKLYKIIGEYTIMLGSGAQFVINRGVAWNRVITKYTNSLLNNDYVVNTTLIPMFIVRGSACGIIATNTLPLASATEITYSKTKIGVIESQEHYFGAVKLPQVSIKRNFNGLLTNSAQYATQINDEDDAQLMEEI